jgi:hypothetical protein
LGSKSWQNLCPAQSCFIGSLSTTRKQCDHQKPPKYARLAVGAAIYSAYQIVFSMPLLPPMSVMRPWTRREMGGDREVLINFVIGIIQTEGVSFSPFLLWTIRFYVSASRIMNVPTLSWPPVTILSLTEDVGITASRIWTLICVAFIQYQVVCCIQVVSASDVRHCHHHQCATPHPTSHNQRSHHL